MAYLEKDIPCDLFLEHLNRIYKETVQSLGCNFSEKALKRASQCVGVLDCMLDRIDRDLSIVKESGSHTLASSDKDKHIIIKELLQTGVFTFQQDRESSFTSIESNVVSSLIYNNNCHKWIKKKLFITKIRLS